MGTIACTTRFTTHGRALCLLGLRVLVDQLILGYKNVKTQKLGYKSPERPENNGFVLGTNSKIEYKIVVLRKSI